MSAVMTLGSCSENRTTAADAIISSIVSEAEASSSPEASSAPETEISSETTVSAAETDAADTVQTTSSGTNAPETSEAGASGTPIDIDLTVMNSTMIYSVIYDIMVEPQNYFGKCLMVDGYFDTMYLDQFASRYYFVVVPDATACCVQGLEFRFDSGNKKYPDDYPEVRDDIRVKGVLRQYEEGGQMYAYIDAEELSVL